MHLGHPSSHECFSKPICVALRGLSSIQSWQRRDVWLRSRGWLVLRVDDHSGINSMLDQVTKVCRLVRNLRTSSADQNPQPCARIVCAAEAVGVRQARDQGSRPAAIPLNSPVSIAVFSLKIARSGLCQLASRYNYQPASRYNSPG